VAAKIASSGNGRLDHRFVRSSPSRTVLSVILAGFVGQPSYNRSLTEEAQIIEVKARQMPHDVCLFM
jgi:hypothetical protein